MTAISNSKRGNLLRRLARDKRGVSAVEFALLAPVMVGLYLSCVEISQAIGVDRKVTQTAGALANIASQVTTISNSDMTDILNAATDVMTPYPTTTLKITVSSVKIDSTGAAKVVWSDTRNGTARAVGSAVTIPSALAVANTYIILSEVEYGYTPTIGRTITGTLTLSDKMWMSPRLSSSVARTS
ncbi:MAG: pilus assembly protein [Pseudolabrys sp.]|nr:pilus assembly protein [Pseudolabrys sp.]MBV9954331.1 pilus assembly protein [Pseudolabrys sp.]